MNGWILTKVCRSLDVPLRIILSDLTRKPAAEKTGTCLVCASILNNPSYCRMMDFKECAKGRIMLQRLINSNNSFSEIISDVCNLNTPTHQTANNSTFVEMVKHSDDQLIRCI